MILLGAVCHLIFGLSTEPCDFIIKVATMIVKMALSTISPKRTDTVDEYDATQRALLDQLPTSLYTALDRLRITGQTTMFAACPTCNYTHEPIYDRISATFQYPTRCTNRIVGSDGDQLCDAELLKTLDGRASPIKPFVTASFRDYLARCLADPEVERLCKQACRDAMNNLHSPPGDSKNIFDSAFMKSFKGPTPGKLFIDGGNKIRLAFAMHVDFFHPNGTRKRGNHDSVGIISLANLNLPETIRYLPENIYLAGVIPGPREPELDQLGHFIRPIIAELKTGWDRGFHISQTADAPKDGEDVEVAVVLSINDLPAARKVSGLAGTRSRFYCSVCDCSDRKSMYNTDFATWKRRDVLEMRRIAEMWRDARTTKTRHELFEDHGIRWSELWNLPYWDPTQMLVIDSMHCILEGIVHYHCRRVLCIDAEAAKAKKTPPPAFVFPRNPHHTALIEQHGLKDADVKAVTKMEKVLTLPFNAGDNTFDEPHLIKRLCDFNLNQLKFTHSALGLTTTHGPVAPSNEIVAPPKRKMDFAKSLVRWVSGALIYKDGVFNYLAHSDQPCHSRILIWFQQSRRLPW